MIQTDYLSNAVEALQAQNRAIRAADWKGLADERNDAGLYTWWVDKEGAASLAQGLGVSLSQGLIYCGQAGATRRPSGTRSDQTLNGRIRSNHLTGSIRGSTFRRTLAAALMRELSLQATPGRKAGLTRQSEAELSNWMRCRLSLLVWPFADRDVLGELEEQVLSQLDPQMNLRGMTSTQLRSAIRSARKNISDVSQLDAPIAKSDIANSIKTRSSRSVTLHEEISDILVTGGNRWMTTGEIAELVNERGLYQKRDNSAVTNFQIHGRTRKHTKLFERSGQRVRLASH